MSGKAIKRTAAAILLVTALALFHFAKTDLQFLAVGIVVGFAGRAFWHP
jgi:nitrate/nitrite transporter NarK